VFISSPSVTINSLLSLPTQAVKVQITRRTYLAPGSHQCGCRMCYCVSGHFR